jgi:formyltetrahydrofolate deformylase
MSTSDRFILTLHCPDERGIVAAVANFLLEQECNITESAEFHSVDAHRFFMRVVFTSDTPKDLDALTSAFGAVVDRFSAEWKIYDAHAKARTILMVSRFGHALNDLLFRNDIGELPLDIVGIVSNHTDFEKMSEMRGIPFYHIPVPKGGKAEAEAKLLELYHAENCELVVLARYMQVISDDLSTKLHGHIINIHHSFLPSFKGAKPYHQAHARGVKMIGATGHYVTADLDEGPIIEQDAQRVTHAMSADQMVAAGRDIESIVLGRAVTWHAERRVLIWGNRTIVFR